MSAGGESSSEKLTSPIVIVAHETDDDTDGALNAAWDEYNVLETARHRSSRARDYAREKHHVKSDAVVAPTALSIMRRQRGGSEDVFLAASSAGRANEEEKRGDVEEEGRGNGTDVPVPPVTHRSPHLAPMEYMASFGPGPLHRHHPLTMEYMRDRMRWEQEVEQTELHRYYYEDAYNYGYGHRGPLRTQHDGNGHHAPVPSFLGDAYCRQREGSYVPDMGMGIMRDPYLPKQSFKYDAVSSSDHGPRTSNRAPSLPNLVPPSQQISQGGQRADVNARGSKPVSVPSASLNRLSPQSRGAFIKDGRVYQEMDWKHDRLWREDDHTRTSNVGHDLQPTSPYQGPKETVFRSNSIVGCSYPPVLPPSIPSHFSNPQGPKHPLTTTWTSNTPSLQPQAQPNRTPPPQQPHPNSPPQQPKSYRTPPKKSVNFSTLQIRTYETILGDNPSCSTGPSLGLGWRYDPSHYTSTIDEYERHQSQLYRGCADPRPEDLVLQRFEREAILLNTGYTRQDLAESVRGITKVKNRRRQTVHNLPAAWAEERLEGCRRTLRRWILNRDRTRAMYDEWREMMGQMGVSPQGSQGCTRGILIRRRSG
ncbi:hypothetical protein HJC23_010513 [Cyclotella cryptica]|uniref:Uncharacterized protein n=1 Tax=Cyclotella cryptica TaxID=29204 RepID=A0ABD3QBD8_9STRA